MSLTIKDPWLTSFIQDHPSFDYERVLLFHAEMMSKQEENGASTSDILDGMYKTLERLDQESKRQTLSGNKDFLERLVLEIKSNIPSADTTSLLPHLNLLHEKLGNLSSNSPDNKIMEHIAVILNDISSLRNASTSTDTRVTSVLTRLDQLHDSLTKKKENSTVKGSEAELEFYPLLCNTFPAHCVTHTKVGHMMDFSIEDAGGFKVGLELKKYTNNVTKEEVDKFHGDMRSQQCSGIIVSLDSKIVGVDALKMKVIDKYLAVYISNSGDNMHIVKMAYDIIYNWTLLQNDKQGTMFSEEALDDIIYQVNNMFNNTLLVKKSLLQALEDLNRVDTTRLLSLLQGKQSHERKIIKITKTRWACDQCEKEFKTKTLGESHRCYEMKE